MDVVGLDGGGCEEGERIEAGPARGQPGRVDSSGFSPSHQVQGCFGVGSAGVQSDSFGGHNDTSLTQLQVGCECCFILTLHAEFVEESVPGGGVFPKSFNTRSW